MSASTVHPHQDRDPIRLALLGPRPQLIRNPSSSSSLLSDASFYSAHQVQSPSAIDIHRRPSPLNKACHLPPSPMSRADSGYSDGQSGRRPSDSNTRSSIVARPRRASPKANRGSLVPARTSSTRTEGKSSSRRSHARSNTSCGRPSHGQTCNPSLQPRCTTSNASQSNAHQYFQFPSFSESSPLRPSSSHGNDHLSPSSTLLQSLSSNIASKGPGRALTPSPPPMIRRQARLPPQTMVYWTSEETRRLEYATIDAAKKGVRGLMNKLVPDCILPKDYKTPAFHNGCDDDDKGSVRRYRLHVSGDEGCPTTKGAKDERDRQDRRDSKHARSKSLGWKRFSWSKVA